MRHHYIVGIGLRGAMRSKPGKPYLDFFIHIPHKKIKDLEFAMEAARNKLFPTESEEANKTFGVSNIAAAFFAASVRSHIHELITCHFTSSSKLNRKWFETYVEYTPFEDLKKAQLKRVRSKEMEEVERGLLEAQEEASKHERKKGD